MKNEISPNWIDRMQYFSFEFPILQWYTHNFNRFPETYSCDSGKFDELDDLLQVKNGFRLMHTRYLDNKKTNEPRKAESFFVKDETIVVLNFNGDEEIDLVTFFFKSMADVKDLIRQVKEQKKALEKGKVYITRFHHHLSLQKVKIMDKLDPDQLALHYGQEFVNVHEQIKKLLNDENSRFILLHGKPGTGKTNYIRHIVNRVDKTFIFIPSDFLKSISSPDFTDFLLQHKSSIFIIEDAESALVSRNQDPNSPVNTFLNITDGLLSDVFAFKFIVTLNSDVKKLDEAILRKGRLSMAHEFGLLNIEQSNALAKHLGINSTFNEPSTLADIYNERDNGFLQVKSKLGFK